MNVDTLQYLKKKQKDKQVTYNGYKKSQILSMLQKELMKGNINKSCTLAAELHISGFITPLLNKLILFASKEINCANPRIAEYIWNRYKNIVIDKKNPISSCNVQIHRNYIIEMVSVLALSNKKNCPKIIKIKKKDFSNNTLTDKIQCKDDTFLSDIWSDNSDPKCLNIPINEFAYLIHYKNDSPECVENVIWWLSFIMEIVRVTEKKVRDIKCKSRIKKGVDPKFSQCYIWILWEIIIKESICRNNYKLKKQINSLYHLFTHDFTKGKIRGRIWFLIHAILFLVNYIPIEKMDLNSTVYGNKYDIIINACANVNELYMSISKPEPNIDSPFNICILNDEPYELPKKPNTKVEELVEIMKKPMEPVINNIKKPENLLLKISKK